MDVTNGIKGKEEGPLTNIEIVLNSVFEYVLLWYPIYEWIGDYMWKKKDDTDIKLELTQHYCWDIKVLLFSSIVFLFSFFLS